MKTKLLFSIFLLSWLHSAIAQVTVPAVRANFGVDGDLRANFFNGVVDNGNDDWFKNSGSTGDYVIDTTGASYVLGQYISNANTRKFPFFRGMRYPQMSVVNNKLWVDGIFIRDHHGDDSTVFASGSNKNGQSPGTWITPISQGIPDKNDILDMMMHVRRDGPSLSDSLWLFGGVSLESTSGNRYFDFEMYQTDIVYNRPTLNFSGFGPDAGHTSWQFDASGNVTRPGDVIFTAEFGSSDIAQLEARIWVNKNALLTPPAAFNWGGAFDGASAGSTFGYANILPKAGGDFYGGYQSDANTWVGPFNVVRQNNSLSALYSAKQFLEFSVNLSKLGLDYFSTSSDPCSMPFRRILVKSRSSTSFNAELKDFVGPFDFFRAPKAAATASNPTLCGSMGNSVITVDNALPTSLYTWTTPDGHIVGGNIGPSINVDKAGNYIVSQQIMDSCGISYAKDTVAVFQNLGCSLLNTTITKFYAEKGDRSVSLKWIAFNAADISYFEVQRRIANESFETVGDVSLHAAGLEPAYFFIDNLSGLIDDALSYRLKWTDRNGKAMYSNIIALRADGSKNSVKVLSNVSKTNTDVIISSTRKNEAIISVFNTSGRLIHTMRTLVQGGTTMVKLSGLDKQPGGVYVIKVVLGTDNFTEKLLLMN